MLSGSILIVRIDSKQALPSETSYRLERHPALFYWKAVLENQMKVSNFCKLVQRNQLGQLGKNGLPPHRNRVGVQLDLAQLGSISRSKVKNKKLLAQIRRILIHGISFQHGQKYDGPAIACHFPALDQHGILACLPTRICRCQGPHVRATQHNHKCYNGKLQPSRRT